MPVLPVKLLQITNIFYPSFVLHLHDEVPRNSISITPVPYRGFLQKETQRRLGGTSHPTHSNGTSRRQYRQRTGLYQIQQFRSGFPQRIRPLGRRRQRYRRQCCCHLRGTQKRRLLLVCRGVGSSHHQQCERGYSLHHLRGKYPNGDSSCNGGALSGYQFLFKIFLGVPSRVGLLWGSVPSRVGHQARRIPHAVVTPCVVNHTEAPGNLNVIKKPLPNSPSFPKHFIRRDSSSSNNPTHP